MKLVCMYEQAPALYPCERELGVHYPSSSFWTCPFSHQTQWQVESHHGSYMIIYYIHCNAFLSFFTSPPNKVEQSCNKAIKICVVKLSQDSGTINNSISQKWSIGRALKYVQHKSAMPQDTTEHFSLILLSPPYSHHQLLHSRSALRHSAVDNT